MTNLELLNKFKNTNTSVNVVAWCPMENDECKAYADTKYPIIRVTLDNGSWLRVYIDKEYHEVTWY